MLRQYPVPEGTRQLEGQMARKTKRSSEAAWCQLSCLPCFPSQLSRTRDAPCRNRVCFGSRIYHFTFSILLMIVQRCGLALGRPTLRCTECTLTDWMCFGSVPHHRKSTWSWGIAKISRRALLKLEPSRHLSHAVCCLVLLFLPTAHCRHIVSCSRPVA